LPEDDLIAGSAVEHHTKKECRHKRQERGGWRIKGTGIWLRRGAGKIYAGFSIQATMLTILKRGGKLIGQLDVSAASDVLRDGGQVFWGFLARSKVL